MTYLQQLVLSAFDVLTTFILISNLLDKKVIDRKKMLDIGVVLLVLLMQSTISYKSIGLVGFLANAAVFILIVTYMSGCKLVKVILSYIFCSFILIPIQIVIALLINLVANGAITGFSIGLVVQVLTLISVFLLDRMISLRFLLVGRLYKSKTFLLTIASLLVVILCLLYIWWFYTDFYVVNFLLSIIVVMIGSSVILLVIFQQYRRNNELREIDMYKRQQKTIEELMMSIRSVQHDYDNHIQAIKSSLYNVSEMNYCNSINAIDDYLQGIEKDNKLMQIGKLSNVILSGFLYSKHREAEKAGVNINFDIDNFSLDSKMQNHNLIAIVGILIDNALEASEPHSSIILKLHYTHKNIIEVLNESDYLEPEVINEMFIRGNTTKDGELRGIGLSNVNRILSKNNGIIKVYNTVVNNMNHICFRVEFE